MSEIKALKNKRKTIICKVEKLYDRANKANLDGATEKTKKDFSVRYESLFEDVAKFETLHLDIVGLIGEDKLEEENKVQETFYDMYFAIKSIYKDLFEDQPLLKQNSSKPNSVTGAVNVPLDKCDRLRLPKIEIAKFDGNIKKWPTFFDMFRSLIHESLSLTNIERFQFLVSYLEKDAAAVIKNIPITEANYETAYNALVKRYQNDRVLVTDYWMSIYQAPILKTKSATELRKLLSIFSENLSALDLFKIDLWDFTKFNLLFQKLDPSLKTLFELEYNNKTFPEYNDLFIFLEKHCKAVENSQLVPRAESSVFRNKGNNDKLNRISYPKFGSDPGGSNGHSGPNGQNKRTNTYSFLSKLNTSKCSYCKQSAHSLTKCDAFLCADVNERHSFVKNKRLCFNCLSYSHTLDKCESGSTCRVCQKRHHTLLHFPSKFVAPNDNVKTPLGNDDAPPLQSNGDQTKSFSSIIPSRKCMLFATALITVFDNNGKPVRCRALLDSASQASFVSENCLKKLGVQPSKSSTPIQGLNQMSMCVSLGNVSLKFSPCENPTLVYNVDAVVLPQICGAIPIASFYLHRWKYLKNLNLADPEQRSSAEVDILFGVDIFSQIILPGCRRSENGGPCAINTTLGWILFGPVDSSQTDKLLSCFTTLSSPLDETLKRFWELDSIPSPKVLSPDDITCENIFCDTYKREVNGRYVVGLPFRTFPPSLGESRTQALRRFKLLESRLEKNSDLKNLYVEFMQDYLNQGHMTPVKPLTNPSNGYFIPHHCVVKNEGDAKKIRVVFDASAKSSNGSSLNDCLFTGPKLQNEIISILLYFRIFNVVFTADIRQMYRQILVAHEFRDYQRILWRSSSNEPIQEFRLNTVTYGVSSSPYLAIRSLLQLVNDHEASYPLAAQVIRRSTYVDDIMAGAFSVPEAMELQRQLIELLSLGCFELRKWSSNNMDLLQSVPAAHQQVISFGNSEQDSGMKVLGLQWSPMSDCFSYSIQPSQKDCTKRNILSEIARVYDPLGFLSPTILLAKCLMQKLWLQGLDWDASPCPDIMNQWKLFQSQLSCLSAISIPRRFMEDHTVDVEVHGFCDASEVGYAAVVYFRQVLPGDNIVISLVCAKNRVSPLKRISVPRLELCAALLLAECLEFVMSNISNVRISKVFAWSDSSVALAWIRSPPHKWKTFVANRVSQIQEKVPPHCWHYVDGRLNPSDCASRGILPEQLVSHPLWWAGPPWLRHAQSTWPLPLSLESPDEAACEERKIVCVAVQVESLLDELVLKYSSLKKIQRIVAYCVRFVNNLRLSPDVRQKDPLCHRDLYHAVVVIVKMVQKEVFKDDLVKIQQNLPCSKPLRKLAPFLDSSGVIRVGGRLKNACIDYDAMHPMLLPRNHAITNLIIQHFHNENLHPGPRALQYLIAQQFWILSARRAIRHVLSKCYKCFRLNPSPLSPYMSDLPPARVSQVKAFTRSGVDFAGPISVTLSRYRGVRSQKAYICVFVCLGTKAVHLEAVSDLSSEAFLAALRRFVARRGRCTDLYSDRGTNLVGANNMLLSYCKQSSENLAIKWHFNPPASPHWGGIWESVVRSVKTHLFRVIGSQLLTFEELMTLLAQIEAALNSRPLCSMSPDPNDLTSLTPGHFLTTSPLTAPPDEDLADISRLNRWQLIQQMHQHFWKRWHVEYLNTLQVRAKWNCPQSPPKVGTLVVVKENNSPPLRWLLGRIVKLYSSPDQVVRVAQIRTTKGLMDRPLVKLCPLPNQ